MKDVCKYALSDNLRPIGKVMSEGKSTFDMPVTGKPAAIKVYPEYAPAMHRMADHNYFWVLCWFHEADRSMLRKIPGINPALPEYGVFGLRTPSRPNPVSLTLVKLEKIEGETLYVTGLDAIDGTPVLDIKPYFEVDIVFSPKTPYIPPATHEMRTADFRKQALAHHGEECLGLELGVKMALLIEEYFGKIQSPDLKLTVEGDACLADVLQGLTRARLANPSRFIYRAGTGTPTTVTWEKIDKAIKLTVRPDVDLVTVQTDPGQDLFDLEFVEA